MIAGTSDMGGRITFSTRGFRGATCSTGLETAGKVLTGSGVAPRSGFGLPCIELVEIEFKPLWDETTETILSSSNSFLTGAVTVTVEAVDATEGARSVSDGRRARTSEEDHSESIETTEGLRD